MSQKHSNMRNYSGQHRKSLCELNTLKRYSVSVRMLVLAFSSPGLSTVWQSTAVDSQWCSCNSCWHKCKERKTHKQRKAAAAASFTYIVEIHPIMAKVQIWKQFDSDLTLSYVGKKANCSVSAKVRSLSVTVRATMHPLHPIYHFRVIMALSQTSVNKTSEVIVNFPFLLFLSPSELLVLLQPHHSSLSYRLQLI